MRHFETKIIIFSILLISLLSFDLFFFFKINLINLREHEKKLAFLNLDFIEEELNDIRPDLADPFVIELPDLLNAAANPQISYIAQADGGKAPTVYPPRKQSGSYFDKSKRASLWGSFLYWRPSQGFMDIAMKTTGSGEFIAINNAGGTSWKHAKRIELNPYYQPGFQIGFALAPTKNWEVFAEYTKFNFDAARSISSPSNGFLFGRWIQPGVVLNNNSTYIKAKWIVSMDILNVEAGRNCYLGRRVNLKPHFGLATAWIDQEFKGRYLLNVPVNELKMRHESDSWGIGPRAGVDVDWRLFRGFGMMGTVAVDLLYTHYDLHLRARSPNNSALFAAISSELDLLRAELEFYLGFNTRFRVAGKTYLNLDLGYNFQIWWNQNMMRWNNDAGWTSSPEGNLYLDGLRLALKLDF